MEQQYPKIKIEILTNPIQGDAIRIYIGSYNILMRATTASPPGFGWYTIGATTAETNINLYNALQATYGDPFSFYPYFDAIPYVEITCNLFDAGNFTYDFDSTVFFKVTVTPVIAPVVFGITGVNYTPAIGNKCENVLAHVSVKNGTAPYQISSHYNGGKQEEKEVDGDSGLFLEFPRNTAGTRQIQVRQLSDLLNVKVVNIPIISKLLGVSANINYGVTDATVVLFPQLSDGLSIGPFQFSIDDIVYQSSDTFSISAPGDYRGYIIDKYGCKKSVEFTVDMDARKPNPYFKIEITNPLRFVEQGYAGIKNIANTLSSEYDAANIDKRFFRQPFRVGDVVRTQFKSNYETHAVKLYDCNDVLIDTLTPVLKVKNVNQLDKRDVIIKRGEGGTTKVAFIQGNIYDPVTGDITDNYFQSNGILPSFVRVGMLLTFDDTNITGTFEVEDVIYDNDLQAWACVIDVTLTNPVFALPWVTASAVALSTYNIEDYNIYEFGFNENAGQYYAIIEATDSSTMYPDILFKSEPIYFADDVPVVVIDYSSEINDALIDYSTGVVFRLCIPGRMIKYQPSVDGEEFKDDLGNIFLQKSTYNRTWGIETDLIPWWLAEKVIIASRHRQLSIDGIQVVNTDAPEVADRIGERNPYYQITGVYQENTDISISDETGIISGARGILSGNENQVIGI